MYSKSGTATGEPSATDSHCRGAQHRDTARAQREIRVGRRQPARSSRINRGSIRWLRPHDTSTKVLPAEPTAKLPDGTTGYAETVLMRLIDSRNGPHKLATTEDGSALVLGGEKGYTQLLSRGTDPSIKLVTTDGRERTIRP
jgi:hypothetical protein